VIRCPAEPSALHELARRVGRLRPCWRQPEAFFEERDELARAIELEAAGRRQDAAPPNFYREPEPVPDARARRLVALAAFQASEIDRLRRMLAQAARPRPRRRRVRDDRQLALALTTAT
jgi:hypothetical protein